MQPFEKEIHTRLYIRNTLVPEHSRFQHVAKRVKLCGCGSDDSSFKYETEKYI